MKRRAEISMEVIIVAAIALLVLVILSVLILRQGGKFGAGTSCQSAAVGGSCEDSCEYIDGSIPSDHPGCSEGEICCVPLFGGDE